MQLRSPPRIWPRRASLALCFATLSAALLASIPSSAQADDTARQLAREAVELFKAERYCDAAKLFQESYDQEPNTKLLVNIGLAQENCGLWQEAVATYQLFVKEAPRSMASTATQVRAQEEALSLRIPRIRLEVSNLDERDKILLDGKAISREFLEDYIPLNPGEHELIIERPVGPPFKSDFRVVEGERRVNPLSVPDLCPDEDGDGECDEQCVDRNLDGTCDKDACNDWDAERQVCLDGPEGAKDEGSVFSEPLFWIITGAVLAAGAATLAIILLQPDDPSPAPSVGGPYFPTEQALTSP